MLIAWQVRSLGHTRTGDCICTVGAVDLECPATGHSAAVCFVGFSPDGTRVVSGSADHRVKIWNVGTGAEVRSGVTSSSYSALQFSFVFDIPNDWSTRDPVLGLEVFEILTECAKS